MPFPRLNFGVIHIEGVAEPLDVGMLHGASERKALRLSGCTSVHPYKYDDIFKFCNTPELKEFSGLAGSGGGRSGAGGR